MDAAQSIDFPGEIEEEIREEVDASFKSGLEGRGECLSLQDGALLVCVGREGGRRQG